LQVGIWLRVAGDDKLGAVRRPVEPGHVPCPAGQLRNVTAVCRHYKQMVVTAVDEALAVVLVIEAAGDSRDWSPPQLIPAFRRSGVVDDRVRIAQDRADEGDLASVSGPRRAGGALRQRCQLAGVARASHVENEDLVHRAAPAHESHAAAVGRPFRRVIPPRTRRCVHRLWLQQATYDDAAPILARLGVRPSELVSDPFPIRAQPDVVDPAEPVKIFRDDRSGHPVSRFKQQKQSLCALPTFLLAVSSVCTSPR